MAICKGYFYALAINYDEEARILKIDANTLEMKALRGADTNTKDARMFYKFEEKYLFLGCNNCKIQVLDIEKNLVVFEFNFDRIAITENLIEEIVPNFTAT